MSIENDDWQDAEKLHFAAQHGDMQSVRDLVSSGVDVNAFDEIGMTPLHYAVKSEHFEVAKLLIDRGANVNAHHEPTISNTPLGDIAGTCSLKMAQLLIEAGADPTIPGWMQLTALDRSSKRKRGDGPQVHEMLLKAAHRSRTGAQQRSPRR